LKNEDTIIKLLIVKVIMKIVK